MIALNNKVALITGGTKGIGLGIAEKMASENMRIAITGRHADECKAIANKLLEQGAADALGFPSDVRDREALQYCVQQMMDRWGQIDVVIANAGVGHFAPIDDMTHDQWNEVIDTNLTGVFNTVKATVEALKSAKGYLITIAS